MMLAGHHRRGRASRELAEAKRAARPNINGSRDEPLRFSLGMFEHASAYTDIDRALVGGRGGGVAVNEIRRILLRRR
jgi:hypothetical protein